MASRHHHVVRMHIKESKAKDFKWLQGKASRFVSQAAEFGYDDVVKLLIEKKIRLEPPRNPKSNPILLAAQHGHLSVLSYLLSQAHTRTAYCNTSTLRHSLFAAAQGGHVGIARFLLACKTYPQKVETPSVNRPLKAFNGRRPLHEAAEANHLEMAKFLIEAGADVDATSARGQTALYLATLMGRRQMVQILISAGADVDIGVSKSPLMIACKLGWLGVVKSLLESSIAKGNLQSENGDTNTPSPLIRSSNDDVSITRLESFLEHPIYLASRHGHEPVVKYLLDQIDEADCRRLGLSFEKSDDRKAIVDRRYQICKKRYLRNQGASPWDPLLAASQRGHAGVVELLISQLGADVNLTNPDGETPLYLAAGGGHLQTCRLLIGNGATVDSNSEQDGETPLCNAARNGSAPVVKFLLASGASASVRTRTTGLTPLHFAARTGSLACVQALLSHGDEDEEEGEEGQKKKKKKVEVDAKSTPEGKTPLFLAAKRGHAEVVSYLAERGACVNVTTTGGTYTTPLNAASKAGRMDVVSLLLGLGARGNQGKSRKKRDQRRKRNKKETVL